jgi:hypothetical protein
MTWRRCRRMSRSMIGGKRTRSTQGQFDKQARYRRFVGGSQDQNSKELWPLDSFCHQRPNRISARRTSGTKTVDSAWGEEFLGCVDAGLQPICRVPELHAEVHQDYRRVLVRRFPYAIFYEYTNDIVTLCSVFHTSRDSDKWRKRLP